MNDLREFGRNMVDNSSPPLEVRVSRPPCSAQTGIGKVLCLLHWWWLQSEFSILFYTCQIFFVPSDLPSTIGWIRKFLKVEINASKLGPPEICQRGLLAHRPPIIELVSAAVPAHLAAASRRRLAGVSRTLSLKVYPASIFHTASNWARNEVCMATPHRVWNCSVAICIATRVKSN